MIDESGRILSAVPGQGAKVHVVSRELERFQKDAATLAKDEADLRVSGRLRVSVVSWRLQLNSYLPQLFSLRGEFANCALPNSSKNSRRTALRCSRRRSASGSRSSSCCASQRRAQRRRRPQAGPRRRRSPQRWLLRRALRRTCSLQTTWVEVWEWVKTRAKLLKPISQGCLRFLLQVVAISNRMQHIRSSSLQPLEVAALLELAARACGALKISTVAVLAVQQEAHYLPFQHSPQLPVISLRAQRLARRACALPLAAVLIQLTRTRTADVVLGETSHQLLRADLRSTRPHLGSQSEAHLNFHPPLCALVMTRPLKAVGSTTILTRLCLTSSASQLPSRLLGCPQLLTCTHGSL